MVDPWRGELDPPHQTNESLIRIRRIKPANPISGSTLLAETEVRIEIFVPDNLNPEGEKPVKEVEDVALATLLGNGSGIGSASVKKKMNRVLYEGAVERTETAIWENRGKAGFEEGETRAIGVGDSEGGAGEVDGVGRDGGKLGGGGAAVVGGGTGSEEERGGRRLELEEGESEVVNGDERVRRRAMEVERRVAAAWGSGERKWRWGGR